MESYSHSFDRSAQRAASTFSSRTPGSWRTISFHRFSSRMETLACAAHRTLRAACAIAVATLTIPAHSEPRRVYSLAIRLPTDYRPITASGSATSDINRNGTGAWRFAHLFRRLADGGESRSRVPTPHGYDASVPATALFLASSTPIVALVGPDLVWTFRRLDVWTFYSVHLPHVPAVRPRSGWSPGLT